MTTDDESALLKAVIENPDDDAPRLAYAEWCDRRGDPRGRFIRVQVELAKLGNERFAPGYAALSEESLELLSNHQEEWDQSHPKTFTDPGYYRGFLSDISITAERFLQDIGQIYATFPIQHLTIEEMSDDAIPVLTSPYLNQIDSLSLTRCGLGDEDMVAFSRSPHVQKIWWMDLSKNRIGVRGVEALASSQFLSELSFVSLEGNPCNPIEEAGFDQGSLVHRKFPKEGANLERRFGYLKWLHVRTEDLVLYPPKIHLPKHQR